jgi:hypothetical protein
MTIEVYTPRWANLLRKLFVGKGTGGQLLQVLDDVLPVVPLVDAAEAEQHYVRDEQTWAIGTTTGAGAGRPFVELWNPVGSGRLVVVERLSVGGSSAVSNLCVFIASVAPVTPVLTRVTDMRWGLGSFVTAITPQWGVDVTGAVDQLTGVAFVALALAGAPQEVIGKDTAIVCPPGSGVAAQLNVVGQSFNFTISGYSRNLDPGE